jgi:hypothetical protein
MNKQQFTAITLLVLLSLVSFSPMISAKEIGVKKGDWIEYSVVATGDFPGEHNAKWARIEIVNVQGQIILVNVTTQLTTDEYVYYNVTVDFEKGDLEEGFFLPRNVTLGDVFTDSLVGNITVIGVEQRTYVGAERTIVKGDSPNNKFFWDEAKGIMVEAHSSYPDYNYTIDTIMEKTNMWQSQILGLEPIVFYSITIAAISVAAIISGLVFWRRRKIP